MNLEKCDVNIEKCGGRKNVAGVGCYMQGKWASILIIEHETLSDVFGTTSDYTAVRCHPHQADRDSDRAIRMCDCQKTLADVLTCHRKGHNHMTLNARHSQGAT